MNRLVQATHPQATNPAESFTCDLVCNRTSSHLSTLGIFDAANRLLEDSTFTYTYDANGNLIEKRSKATGDLTRYTYDAENQLITVEQFTVVGGSVPVMVAEYHYDALGRRIEKVVNGVSTRYIYDNEDIIAELDGTAAVKAIYLHGPGIDEPLAMFRSGVRGGPFTYHADGLGSITTITDAFGTPVRTYTYDSFGRIVVQTGTVINPFTFTAREFDLETGLYHYRARSYDPGLGRFLQEDPIGFIGGPNFYGYVRGNPQRFIDPLGLQPLFGPGDRMPVGPVSVGFGTSFLFLDSSWNTDNPSSINYNRLTLPELGFGFTFCQDISPSPEDGAVNIQLTAPESTCKSFAGERSRTMPAERPRQEGRTYSMGLKYLGVSFPDNQSRVCLNLGIAAGLGVNVSTQLDSLQIVPVLDLGG